LGTKNKIRNYKYNNGDTIKTKNGEIEILEQITIIDTRKSNIKAYKYKCLIDGNIDNISESSLKRGVGCNVCSNNKVLKGCNDLWTTHPEIAQLLKYPEIGHGISYGKTEPEIFICPDCGYKKSININSLIRQEKFPCPNCGDSISYPEKFGIFLFNQLEEIYIVNNFEYQYNPNWIKPKRYDFYFELDDKGYILEIDGGLGHGNYNPFIGQSAEETQAIDDYKDKLAREHGIEVIRIDCRKSNLEYIKINILHSRLSELFDLSNINWLKCHEFACSSLVKKACELWSNGIDNTKEIGKIMKLGLNTISGYLKQGAKLGWCDYDPEEIQRMNGKNLSQKRFKPVVQLSLDGKFIAEYKGAIEAEEILKIKNINTGISACCNSRLKTANNYRWMFKEDYYKNMNNIKPLKKYESMTISVVQLDLNNNFIKNWNSIREVERELNIFNSGITSCCKGRHKTAGGYRWMYKEDYNEYIKKDN